MLTAPKNGYEWAQVSSMNEIKAMQRALIRLGHPLDRWGADGIVGSETINAVVDWLHVAGIEQPINNSIPQWIVDSIIDAGATADSHSPLIEDVRHDEYQKWDGRNPIKRIDTICLHQMAVKDSDDRGWHRWRRLAIHWVITCGDHAKAYQLHDLGLRLPHGHGWNGRSVGFEFEGYFSGVGTDPKYFWKPKSRPNRQPMVPTERQLEAGRAAVRDTVRQISQMGGKIRYIGAHRQSFGRKTSDPGSLIWQGIALPMMDELRLKEAPTLSHKRYPGRPIPEQWDPRNKGVKY
jgi:hypothetical protein